MRVELRDRKIAEHKPDRVRVAVKQQVHVPGRTSAVGALVVAIFDNRHWSVCKPAHVTVSCNLRCGEHFHLISSYKFAVCRPAGSISGSTYSWPSYLPGESCGHQSPSDSGNGDIFGPAGRSGNPDDSELGIPKTDRLQEMSASMENWLP
jgi:hypothetical protein